MNLEDIKKLADMARIDMDEKEMSELAHDFDSILAYVGQVSELSASPKSDFGQSQSPTLGALCNVMREDSVTNQPGLHTDKILAEMPATEKGYLKVKQIL
jgi:aspartyl/glutamyl-tRNA(Asn/Gln) amidotransferase C subunit